jgi:hypothetical protein
MATSPAFRQQERAEPHWQQQHRYQYQRNSDRCQPGAGHRPRPRYYAKADPVWNKVHFLTAKFGWTSAAGCLRPAVVAKDSQPFPESYKYLSTRWKEALRGYIHEENLACFTDKSSIGA